MQLNRSMNSSPGAIDTRDVLSVCHTGGVLDRALLREMLGYFVDANRRRIAQTADALAKGRRDTLREVAHAVSGSAAMLGAGRLHHLAKAVERNADTGDAGELRCAIDALRLEFSAVVSSLQKAHPEACGD